MSLSFSPAVDHLMNASSKLFIAGNIPIQHLCSTPGQDLDYSLCQLLFMQKHSTNAVKIYRFAAGLARGWIFVWLSVPPYVLWMNIQNLSPPTPCRINHLWSSIYSQNRTENGFCLLEENAFLSHVFANVSQDTDTFPKGMEYLWKKKKKDYVIQC